MSLLNLIKMAESQGAFELLLAPDATPRVRKKNSWIPLSEKTLTAQETRQFLVGLLDEEQRQQLFKASEFEGFWLSGTQRFSCSIQVTARGFVGALSWIPEIIATHSFWGFPKWTEKSLAAGGGLHVLVGKNRLHLESAAVSLIEGLNANTEKSIHWQKSETLKMVATSGSVVTYGCGHCIPEYVDILVLEGSSESKRALEFAEKGKAVLLLVQAHNLVDAFDSFAEAGLAQKVSRYLNWAMGIKILNGSSQGAEGLVPVFDLLAAVEPVRKMIREGKIAELDEWMDKPQSDDTLSSGGTIEGLRTMNQALLQLILKRKIDLKQGFEESPAPEKLDDLLRKVGF